MRNKVVGYLVIGIALLMGFVIYSYQSALVEVTHGTCPVQGPDCPYERISNQQINVNLGILLFVVLIGAYLIFFSKEERVITKVMRVKEQMQPKKLTKEHYHKIMSQLHKDEKEVLERILAAEGSVMQSELVEQTGLTKVKVTRILDRLEGKGVIERKRRGMTNVVILKA
jgi:DNA-binding MarR family transcriptional regulator